ncbi:homeobox-leucine zipper protein HOX32-like [Asparagus officinalis]|uniref:homeobox-leucine zipper protein HOX32-like n=1 Tax=Asparagus officinalis TaxID=4686 RepID=UPI00098E7309|nr:homeobox-leucine zipper protein HOX32-like [Asparagus officinalis]
MTFSHRLSKGFNDAVNGFTDDGWSLLGSDGVEDVTIMINWSPNKLFGSHANSSIFSPIGGGILSAKASMLLQNVPPALLVRKANGCRGILCHGLVRLLGLFLMQMVELLKRSCVLPLLLLCIIFGENEMLGDFSLVLAGLMSLRRGLRLIL